MYSTACSCMVPGVVASGFEGSERDVATITDTYWITLPHVEQGKSFSCAISTEYAPTLPAVVLWADEENKSETL